MSYLISLASSTFRTIVLLHLQISNNIVSTKIYHNFDNLDLEVVHFPVLDCDVPRSTSFGVYIQSYRYHKLHQTFSKFCSRYYDMISKFHVILNFSSIKYFQNISSMVTKCISGRNFLVSIIFSAVY